MVIAAVVGIGVPIALRDQPGPKVVSHSPVTSSCRRFELQVHPKAAAGLGSGTSLDAVATTEHSLLLAGARPVGSQRTWRASIWYSDDASTWHRAQVPTASGEVLLQSRSMTHPCFLAIGTDGTGLSTFVWTSTDHGRHWKVLADGARLFGEPAPQMGRPGVPACCASSTARGSLAGAVHPDTPPSGHPKPGSTGDKCSILQTSGLAGSVDITKCQQRPALRLLGHDWVVHVRRQPVALARRPHRCPTGCSCEPLPQGASVAFGEALDLHGRPTPLLRSSDHGHTWTVAPVFLTQFPDARVLTVTRTRGLWIAAGTSGSPNRPTAWVSTDLTHWAALPASLYGTPGGTLSIIGTLRDHIVLLGSAPELDRYYTLNTPRR